MSLFLLLSPAEGEGWEMIERLPREIRRAYDGISRELWLDIIPSPDTEGKELLDHLRAMERMFSDFQHLDPGIIYARSLQIPRSDFHLYNIASSVSSAVPFVHPHAVTVRPSFQFQRPQTGIPRMSSLVPSATSEDLFDLGMPLDRAFERLRATGF
ncbi:hypothetical protein CK203_030572 [Vitis vinifera]|uniref:Uncharacterized protein n=1 Tax=Vitis vinifera TaxID=29760 RepID=A0A438JDS8_VITVI|nr:hypothetical protein CK203_030572 [Vitis vinifera]